MTTHQEESPPHDDKGEDNEDETRRKDDQETNLTEHPVSDGVAPGVAPDDDDSVSSDSSAEDEDRTPAHDDWQSLTILERRARRIARNEKKLTALGLGYTARQVRRAVAPVPDGDDDDDRPRPRRRGILLDFASAGVYPPKPQEPPGSCSPPTVVDSVRLAPTPKEEEPLGRRLARDFPGRAPVIRALLAHLEMALPPRPATDASSLTAPAPLWISGPAGTGKSALVRAAVDAWRRARPEMLVSYVALEGLPTVSVEAVVRHIYKDLMPPEEEDVREETAPKSRKRPRSATAAAPQAGALPAPRRPRRETAVYTAAAGTTATMTIAGGKSTSVRATAQDMAASTATKASGAYTAIWRLGRVWKSLAARRPSVLVLDQVWVGREPNLLAQFLLLPRQLSMNLTIIVITNNLLLDQTRLNMMTSNSTSSLASSIQPVRIHFPAYRGRAAFESILSLERVRSLIVGDGFDKGDSFEAKVYRSFVRTLVQSIYDTTKNVKEIIRFGRVLWPRYVEPLQPRNIDESITSVSRKLASFQPPVQPTPERMEHDILAFLDRKILPQIRPLTDDYLFALSVPPAADKAEEKTVHDMPHRVKYFLLAAYLCQVNRPDRDKHLFSIQKNGRRRKSATESNTASEDTAFGANAAGGQPKSLRLRTFPLERMLSVFVSLFALHQMESNKDMQEQHTEELLSLGDASLQHNLGYLQSIGLLHEHPAAGPNDLIRLTGRRYWCEMTEDEAMSLAESLQFPLTQYLL